MYEKCLGKQPAQALPQVWDVADGPRWPLPDEPEAGLGIAHEHFMWRRGSADEVLNPHMLCDVRSVVAPQPA